VNRERLSRKVLGLEFDCLKYIFRNIIAFGNAQFLLVEDSLKGTNLFVWDDFAKAHISPLREHGLKFLEPGWIRICAVQ